MTLWTLSSSRQSRASRGLSTISNRPEFAALDSVITVPAAEGTRVFQRSADNRLIAVASTWADGVLDLHRLQSGYVRGPADGYN